MPPLSLLCLCIFTDPPHQIKHNKCFKKTHGHKIEQSKTAGTGDWLFRQLHWPEDLSLITNVRLSLITSVTLSLITNVTLSLITNVRFSLITNVRLSLITNNRGRGFNSFQRRCHNYIVYTCNVWYRFSSYNSAFLLPLSVMENGRTRNPFTIWTVLVLVHVQV